MSYFGSQSAAPPGASPSQFGGYGSGGFVQDSQMSPAGGVGSPGVLSPPSGGGTTLAQKRSLTPVTVRQILKAPEPVSQEPFQIDGHEVATVQVIGQIMDVKPEATFILYTVDDGTGTIAAKSWINEDDNDEAAIEERQGLVKGRYVKVYGRIHVFNGQKSITTFTIQPLKDFNELTHHNLECIYVHLMHSRDSGAQQSGGGQQYGQQPNYNAGGGGSSSSGGQQFGGGGDGGFGGDAAQFTEIQKQVLNIIQGNPNEEGCHIDVVFNSMNGVSRQDIRQAVDFLTNEGHLYSTIDEEHFDCTHE